MKIVSIVGARPQFIKLAPLSKQIRKFHKEIVIHTGQHFDKNMSSSFFSDLDINTPDYNLNINSGSHGNQTAKMIEKIEKILIQEKPEGVIIFGDTNSTFAGAIAASKLDCVLFHVEAGLRSFNPNMPEEINRIISDHVSNYLFAPTKTAIKNLVSENLKEKSYLTGDIMVDSINIALKKISKNNICDKYKIKENEYYLLTLHRPYNVDNPSNIINIFSFLDKIDSKILFPVHPRTNNIININNIVIPKNILLIEPVSYLDFIDLQKNSKKIITDSGGIQKEAYILKKPCITLRSETEWKETVDSGWNLLINPNTENDINLKIESFYPKENHIPLFGNEVSMKMVDLINKLL